MKPGEELLKVILTLIVMGSVLVWLLGMVVGKKTTLLTFPNWLWRQLMRFIAKVLRALADLFISLGG